MYEIKIGPVLKRLLRARGLKLKEVSRLTGIPYSTLYTWYENRQPKDILKAQLLADHLSLTLHQLLFDQPDSREKKPPPETPQQTGEDFFKGRFEVTVKKLD